MSRITTHVLDTSTGRPVAGMEVTLRFRAVAAQPWKVIAHGATDDDGRLRSLLPEAELLPGQYALDFDTSQHSAFFPEVTVQFAVQRNVTPGREHYHVPLLLSPFGYSTYRGS
jgi:5-hydroxyisourate hydrolase